MAVRLCVAALALAALLIVGRGELAELGFCGLALVGELGVGAEAGLRVTLSPRFSAYDSLLYPSTMGGESPGLGERKSRFNS